jgi:hypothetical protein
LEFDIEYDENVLNELKSTWKVINDAVKTKTPPPHVPNIVKNPFSGKWKVNALAEWCPYHILCTGDPEWKIKAMLDVKRLNSKKQKVEDKFIEEVEGESFTEHLEEIKK